MKGVAVTLLLAVFTTTASADVIRVVPVAPDNPPTFKCGDRCKFRASVPKEPLRVRIIRGTVTKLAAYANHPGYVAAGCMELLSTVVRPRRPRRAADLLDLQFYFQTAWLAANGRRDGEFVFVLERDDRPNGPAIEETSMLRLPAGPQGVAYFRAGIDVTVRAPVNQALTASFSVSGGGPRTAPTAMMGGDEPSGSSAPPPLAPTPSAATANCIDIVVDPSPVPFRAANASPASGARPSPVASFTVSIPEDAPRR